MNPDVLPLTSMEVGLRPPGSCFVGGIVTIDLRPRGLGSVAWQVLSDSHACTNTLPRGHRQTMVSTCNVLQLWGLTTPHPPQEICVHKRSLPLQRTPLCPEVFCWLKEQMWCRQQQCQLPPASPSTHLEGAAEQEEEVVQPYCFFHSSAF